MTVVSDQSEAPDTLANLGKADPRYLRKSRRRFRSLLRRLDRMLSLRNIIRASAVLLPLGGFLYISLLNVGVVPIADAPVAVAAVAPSLGPSVAVSSETLTDRTVVSTSAARAADVLPADPSTNVSGDAAVDMAVNDRPTVSVNRFTGAWSTVDLGSSILLSEDVPVYRADDEPTLFGSVVPAGQVGKSGVYAVNEGGSLWRTARRFIDDNVLLDKLIDSLEQSGMDMRRIRPGVEFVVNDLGNGRLLITVEDRGEVYESLIEAGNVTTSIQSQTPFADEPSRTARLSR